MAHQIPEQPSNARDQRLNIAEVAFQAALSVLPLHAEEGGRREVISESELVQALVDQNIPRDTSTALIFVLRRQFESLALLDLVELNMDNWTFVSFPASLLGRAWLTTLATPGHALLGADYWEQGDACPQNIKEEQRSLLHRIETGRVRLNSHPQTIRTVHVAWGLIRWGDKFLLHHREDKARMGEKNYGLPGGRFKLSDLPSTVQSRADILKEVYNPASEVVAQHISTTLLREVEEETGLLLDKHYTFEFFGQPLPPYEEVNGAGNRHAYSVYKFHLFQIKLTPAGETHLLSRIAEDTFKLTWFSAAEIAAPQRADGAAAYVDALRQAWGKDLEKCFSTVPASTASPLLFTGEARMLDLPGSAGTPFQLGKPGKEKSVRFVKPLDETEWHLLMLLGWHACGFHIETKSDAAVRLLGNGWIDGQNAPRFIQLARSLLEKIPSDLSGLVEIREDRFISLRISPDVLFLPVSIFQYKVLGSNKDGGVFLLTRIDIFTRWADLKGDRFERDINGNTVATLRELEKGDEPQGDWERSLRDQFGSGVRGVGLRRLWSTKGNLTSLAEGLLRISEV
jgi:8-oxo-dGTP pyrophosphatase MutT (NUDIX family)